MRRRFHIPRICVCKQLCTTRSYNRAEKNRVGESATGELPTWNFKGRHVFHWYLTPSCVRSFSSSISTFLSSKVNRKSQVSSLELKSESMLIGSFVGSSGNRNESKLPINIIREGTSTIYSTYSKIWSPYSKFHPVAFQPHLKSLIIHTFNQEDATRFFCHRWSVLETGQCVHVFYSRKNYVLIGLHSTNISVSVSSENIDVSLNQTLATIYTDLAEPTNSKPSSIVQDPPTTQLQEQRRDTYDDSWLWWELFINHEYTSLKGPSANRKLKGAVAISPIANPRRMPIFAR